MSDTSDDLLNEFAVDELGDAPDEIGRLKSKLARVEKNMQALNDATANMFEQMVRGKWRDDHGHDVTLNKAMLELIEAAARAALGFK